MPQDAIARLKAAFNTDESFRKEFLAANSLDEAAATAARRGCAVSLNDLIEERDAQPEGELSDAELEGVGGGGGSPTAKTTSKIMSNAHEMKKALIANFPR